MSPRPDHGERSYRGSEKLKGKVALITGGDSGIGRAVAIAFAREGADVMISYLTEHDDAGVIDGLGTDDESRIGRRIKVTQHLRELPHGHLGRSACAGGATSRWAGRCWRSNSATSS